MKRYKVVEVGVMHKTVNRADPTRVTKNVSVYVDRYFATTTGAINRINQLEKEQQEGIEMDHAWGAPSECFENRATFEWYIVDRKTGKWYYVYDNLQEVDYEQLRDIPRFELIETEPVEVQKEYVM